MKNSVIVILLLYTIIAIGGCNKEVDNPLPPCDPDIITWETKYYSYQTGTLTLIDVNSNPTVLRLAYLINSPEVANVPLLPCNLPVGYFDISIGDTIDVSFSGSVELIHPNASTNTQLFELTQIKKL